MLLSESRRSSLTAQNAAAFQARPACDFLSKGNLDIFNSMQPIEEVLIADQIASSDTYEAFRKVQPSHKFLMTEEEAKIEEQSSRR